jgi:hypothetical protein
VVNSLERFQSQFHVHLSNPLWCPLLTDLIKCTPIKSVCICKLYHLERSDLVMFPFPLILVHYALHNTSRWKLDNPKNFVSLHHIINSIYITVNWIEAGSCNVRFWGVTWRQDASPCKRSRSVSIFWDITPCSPFKVNRRFGVTSPPYSRSKNTPSKKPEWKQVAS